MLHAAEVTAKVNAAVTSLQFQDLSSQLIGLTAVPVGALHVVAEVFAVPQFLDVSFLGFLE